ncbi:nuclear transport factor 2 family protein [Shinella daejeonensis]|uniref:nuclear transport factor 2 family protein n=1 Tax=Shinella daejeonensis TaxID=659017 RepID=UPI0020C80ECE|nr:nuclear transport factor 2 family protein [Shinella daejeonensis]MCP8893930.1 nuclear transport factor 2 family protein [Shinella daejeonensis]
MADNSPIAHAVVAALNARDFSALAALADEEIALSGFGGGMDMGREALRERLARHFQASDETYGDALVMEDRSGGNIAVRLTARGWSPDGTARSREAALLIEVEEGRVLRLALLSSGGS